MKFFAYTSKFKENRFPIYVITNQVPRTEKEWDIPSYEKVFIGLYFDSINFLTTSIGIVIPIPFPGWNPKVARFIPISSPVNK